MKALQIILFLFLLLPQAGHALSCREELEKLHKTKAHKSIKKFKKFFTKISFSKPDEQKDFIARALPGDQSDGVFFHLENAALKPLAEEVFNDRLLAQALTKYTKLLFLAEFQKKSDLFEGAIVYSDFKTLRVWLPTDTPEARAKLREIYFEVVVQVREMAESLKLERLSHEPYAESAPLGWMLSGIGRTGDHAALGARIARELFHGVKEGTNERVGTVDTDRRQTRIRLEKMLDRVDEKRDEAIGLLDEKLKMRYLPAEANGEGVEVPTGPVMTLLRELPKNPTKADIDLFKIRIKAMFGVRISSESAKALIEYYALVDSFIPPLHLSEETDLNYSYHGQDAIVIDHTGQNNRNLYTAMSALARAKKNNTAKERLLEEALMLMREGQEKATQRFYRNLNLTMTSLPKSLNPSLMSQSGDDVILFDREGLTPSKIRNTLDSLYNNGRGDSVRLVFLSNKDQTPKVLSETAKSFSRSEWLSMGEKIEKRLRQKVAMQFGHWESPLANSVIGVKIDIENAHEASFDIYVRGDQKLEGKIDLIHWAVKQVLEEEPNLQAFRLKKVHLGTK